MKMAQQIINLMIESILFTIAYTLLGLYVGLAAILNIKKQLKKKSELKWAFFHPFCNDGGGGQKVLWCMIKALTEETRHHIAVYSLQSSKEAIVEKVKNRFGIILDANRFQIIHVEGKVLLTSKRFLTMILHLLLPIIYTLKCLWKYQPDVFYDTTGYASTLVAVKFLLPFTKTVAYVHYPFISEDMIQKVKDQRSDFNNSQAISKSPLLSKAKLYYYKIVLVIYKIIGFFVDFAQTNSTWTHGHMSKIWPRLLNKEKLVKLYPPCTVNSLLSFKKDYSAATIQIMSLAQFRPEKQQHLQLEVLSELIKSGLKRNIKLRMCGTTRGLQDQQILKNLIRKSQQLKIQDSVQFIVNQPFSKIQQSFQKCLIGFHTMEAEHFGISIVEMLAAGLIVVAHNSAGPRFDIIKEQRYLAENRQDYTAKLRKIIESTPEDLAKESSRSRQKAHGFGQQQFNNQFLNCLQHQKLA